MLRRVCTISSSSSTTALSAAAAAAIFCGQQRSIAVFAEQSEVAAKHCRYKGFKSNVFWEHDDLWWLGRSGITLNEGAEPITASVSRRIELFNVDEFLVPPQDLPAAELHSSLRSRQPYGKTFQDELQARAEQLGATQKWWLTAREADKRGLRFKPTPAGSDVNMRSSTAIIARAQSKIYNAEQFNKPELAARVPISALSKKPFGTEMSKTLSAHIESAGYSTGLFLTPKQIDLFELRGLLKPDAAPFACPLFTFRSSKEQQSQQQQQQQPMFYNVSQIEGGEELLKKLNRMPAAVPTYVSSGKPLGPAMVECVRALKADFGDCRYWMDEGECARRGLRVKEGAVGFPKPDYSSNSGSNTKQIDLYNADQLTEPAAAFRVAGTKA